MKRFIPALLIFLMLPMIGFSQLSGGFKTGLNFSTLNGPTLSGDSKESYSYSNGFHVGPVVQYKITESFGFKAELLYNQSGGIYKFDGKSFNIFETEDETRILATGDKLIDLNIVNTYLDLPLMGYARIGSFQFDAGLKFGLLVSSTGDGKMVFSGATENGTPIEEYSQQLFFNYRKDEAGEADFTEFKEIYLDGKITKIPSKVGAYYMDKEKNNFFNSLDVGLNVGMAYYIGRSLYISARANLGLMDVTNDKSDFNQVKTEGLDLIRQADQDKNFQVQLSIGFSL